MGIGIFVAQIDREIERLSGGRVRSSFGPTQKAVADRMILDHFDVGSAAQECAPLIWSVLKTLEDPYRG